MKINTIHNCDNAEILKTLPDKSIDLFLEDMPYNTTACNWEYKVDLKQYWELRLPKLKDNGCFVLCGSQPFTTDLIMSNRKMFKYEMIWEKEQASNFLLADKQPLKIHENILIFYNKLPIYNPQKTKGKPYTSGQGYCGEVYDANRKKIITTNNGDRYPTSIIKYNRESGLHPTQKPVDLFRYLIKTYTNKGALAFDGFAGSFTTAIACIKENRNYICCETDKTYFEQGKKRIETEKMQLKLEY